MVVGLSLIWDGARLAWADATVFALVGREHDLRLGGIGKHRAAVLELDEAARFALPLVLTSSGKERVTGTVNAGNL